MSRWLSEIREFLKILLSWPAVVFWLGLILCKPVINLINKIKSIDIKNIFKFTLEKAREDIQEIKKESPTITDSLIEDLVIGIQRLEEKKNENKNRGKG